MKTVLSVGQCRPDNAAISHYLTSHFDVRVQTADSLMQTLQILQHGPVDLVLVNRRLDADSSDGLEILKEIRRHPDWQATPVMLVSNYAEWQETAVSQGALYGFGKAQLNLPATRQRLADVLLGPAESH